MVSINKTNVIIIGSSLPTFFEFFTSYFTEINQDFNFIFVEESKEIQNIIPNIVFLGTEVKFTIELDFLEKISGGGLFIYPDGRQDLDKNLLNVNTYFRKIEYSELTPQRNSVGKYIFPTDFGDLPLQITNENWIKNLLGIKNLSQHLLISEDDFHEFLLSL